MNRLGLIAVIVISVAGSVIAFRNFFPEEKLAEEIKPVAEMKTAPHDTTVVIAGVPVDLKFPAEGKADLLILPGWNFERSKWCNESSLCKKALEKGYRLILPEMGKSIYATNYFPETRTDWLKYPTLTWVCDTMIPFLQKEFGLLKKENKNFIAGLSTGGRGVVLVSNRAQIFAAAAALSGDYDQTMMPTDNLMKGVYGEIFKFTSRWEGVDNPSQQIPLMTTPLYLGHGKADKVVPFQQSDIFYKRIKITNPSLPVVFHACDTCGHDFSYWDSEVDAILNFFEKK